MHDGDGSCFASLPEEACAPGEVALFGESNCHSLAPCATGTWGDIPVAGNTEYVDQNYTGGMSDGTSMRPWTTIQEAVLDAAPGAVVAIAAGTYLENVLITKPVALWGTCPDNVLVSSANGLQAIEVQADGTELHRLSVTSATVGVFVAMASDVVIDRLRVHDTGGEGIYIHDFAMPTSVTIRDSLVEAGHSVGVLVWGSSVTIENSVVRNIDPAPAGDFGRGISAVDNPASGMRTTLVLRRVLVEDTYEVGVGFFGTDATVEDILVRRTEPNQNEGFFGTGIEVLRNKESGERTFATIRRSVVEESHNAGINVVDSELDLQATCVRDTHPEQASQRAGFGVRVLDEDGLEEPAFGTITSSSIARSHLMGLAVVGSDVEVQSLLVRETAPAAADQKFGRGIGVEPSSYSYRPGSLVIRGGVIEHSHEVGLLVLGSHGEIDSVLVRDVRPRPADDAYGAGIVFHLEPLGLYRSDGTVTRAVIEDAYAAGLGVLGADVIASDIITTGIQPQVGADDFGDGVVASAWVQFVDELFPTSLELTRATVTGNARAGIASFAASVTVAQAIVDCNTIHLDAEQLEDLPAIFEDRGYNVCGCGAETVACKVLSSNLAPPPSLPP